jgi:hypothetical protein
VSFINKTLFTNSNQFQYATDSHQHTLFYIPNPKSYSDYAPTILGKTVTLQDYCFFSLTHDTDTVMEILKLKPLAGGSKIIKGNIHADSVVHSGRIQRPRLPENTLPGDGEGFPVVLLNANGDPVRVAYTDSNGDYEFIGLPDTTFQMVVALELDKPVLQDPVEVDVRNANAVVDFGIGSEILTPEKFFEQQIAFSELTPRSYGDSPFTIEVSSSASLPVVLSSSDTTIAKIVQGKIVILKAGNVTITATQSGEGDYLPAEPVEQILVINKAIQTISMAEFDEKYFGDPDFVIEAESNFQLPLSYSSSDNTIASIGNGKILIRKAGSVTITASQAGNDNIAAAESVQRILQVKKITVTLDIADFGEKEFGSPPFQIEYAISKDLPVVVSSSNKTVATISNGKISIHQAGISDITIKVDGGDNYDGIVVTKILQVNKAAQVITFSELADVNVGDESFTLSAAATSGLTVTFTSDNPGIVSIDNLNRVTIHAAGIANITASVDSTINYKVGALTRQLKVNGVTGIAERDLNVKIYPNPVVDFVYLQSQQPIISINVLDTFGKAVPLRWESNRGDFTKAAEGLYIIRVVTTQKTHIIKLVKN